MTPGPAHHVPLLAMAPTPQTRPQPVDPLSGLVAQIQAKIETSPGETAQGRFFAAAALARLDDPLAAEALLDALADDYSLVRAGAARGLGERADRLARSTRLDGDTRARIISGLFMLLENDSANEVRWAAAEAMYKVSGSAGLRPVRSAVRRWINEEPDSAGLHQAWFVHWAAAAGLPDVLVDAYRWTGPDARRSIVEYLRSLPAGERKSLLGSAFQSSDQKLRELAQAVI